MEIFEILFTIAAWILISYLGLRARRRRPTEMSWDDAEREEGRESQPHVPVPKELRELIRHLRGDEDEIEDPESESVPSPEPMTIEEPDIEPVPIPPLPPPRVRTTPSRPSLADDLMRDLGSGPRSLARAVLLREVLGPPVALREPGSDLPGSR